MTIRWTQLHFLPALLLACALLPSPPARADEDDRASNLELEVPELPDFPQESGPSIVFFKELV